MLSFKMDVVAGGGNILGGDKRQPEQVIRKARAHPATRRRIPPVEHIARFELVPRRFQNLRARNVRAGVQQRHHILKLVAEAKRPARLIQRGASPQTASQRLIHQPAVEHYIHAWVGRFNGDDVQDLIPLSVGRIARPLQPPPVTESVRSALRLSSRFFPSPIKKKTSSDAPGARSTCSWMTAHGSSPALTALSNPMRPRAAGARILPMRPKNSVRSVVMLCGYLLAARNATRPPNSLLK